MKSKEKKILIIGLLLLTAVCYCYFFPSRSWLGKPYLETSQKDGFAVVELFTSEGCSSCPPADDLMAEVRDKASGKKIYFLAFHVDYWNRQGWADRFSSPEFSQRQEQYGAKMNNRLIYTPQFIVNGSEEFAGDDSRTLYSMVSDALQKAPVSALSLTAHVKEKSIGVSYTTSKTLKNTSLLLALVKKEDSTRVKRGENWGRSLHHVQIVRQTNEVKLYNTNGTVELNKPEDFNTIGWEVIGLIQNDSTGVINAASKAIFK